MCRLLILATVIVFGLLGCAQAPAKLATPSGRPEITIEASPEKIKAALLAKAIEGGARIVQDTPHQLAYEVRSDNVMLNLIFGSQFRPEAHMRLVFTIVPVENKTRVAAAIFVIGNAGAAFEQATAMESQEVYEVAQKGLEGLAARL